MNVNENDKPYFELVNHILVNDTFNAIGDYIHHGTNRLTHSKRVSYFSYKLAKKLKLDYRCAAVAGLLHDFCHDDFKKITAIEFVKAQFIHPKVAAKNAIKHFQISKKEKNIIETHMFPLTPIPSKHLEGWVISIIDKIVGTYEYGLKFKYQLSTVAVFIVNLFKIGVK
jgi:uncharacterized protein